MAAEKHDSDTGKAPAPSDRRSDGMPVGIPLDERQRAAGRRQIRLKTAENVRAYLANVLRDVKSGRTTPAGLAAARVMVQGAVALVRIIELTDHETQLRELQREIARLTGAQADARPH